MKNFLNLVRTPLIAGTILSLLGTLRAADAPQTERHYLSGRGPTDAVAWDFTITGGRRAGEKTTIPVPSNWELQGFGNYNYGQDRNKSDEHGLYRTRFHAPAEWRGRRIRLVFDGVMTDASVTLNGASAGPVHQGGFTRFGYDVTSLIKLGDGSENENELAVDVAKVCADPLTEKAERGGDYWVFGGIYRSVYLEALPARAIDHLAIDARADGSLTTEVTLGSVHGGRTNGLETKPLRLDAQVLDSGGHPFGPAFSQNLPAGGAGRIQLKGHIPNPKTWSAETPVLYTLQVTLSEKDKILHRTERRFGFRTFEVREGEGLFLNGRRILLKGVNRHSFRPETGRTLSREDCFADARLIREMNMNAVRMSHYPPDEAFLEACDELGLYVLDELSGWQHAHGTAIGRLLVREMVERDVNHPSILLWDNGNEGGWNTALDGEFDLYDPQHRRVLHPWNLHDGIDTKHYVVFEEFARLLRGPNLVMPTEILHALYDGGGGAGLEDYWRELSNSKVGAGMFIWDFADEAVVRTDLGGKLDAHSTYAADGIVGPHFEKEGSYYTIKDLWSPVQIDPPTLDDRFDGTLRVHNRYDFTSLAQCHFAWRLLKLDSEKTDVVASGTAMPPEVAPQTKGVLILGLPERGTAADALEVTAIGPDGVELWTSVWPYAPKAASRKDTMLGKPTRAESPFSANETNAGIVLKNGNLTATFDPKTGLLRHVNRAGHQYALTNGPRLAFAHPAKADGIEWRTWAKGDDTALTRRLPQPAMASVIEIAFANLHGSEAYAGFKLELSADGNAWRTIFDSSRRPNDGDNYIFPPQIVAAVRISNPWRFDDAPAELKTFRIGFETARFPAATARPASVKYGRELDPATGETIVWLETSGGAAGMDRARWTLRGDGSLGLDCAYTVEGKFDYHGVTFDYPEELMQEMHWLGQGPFRVWKNRLRGTWFGLHNTQRTDQQPGQTWIYPEFSGYFAGVRQARFDAKGESFNVSFTDSSEKTYLRVGTPRVNHPSTTVGFPAGNFSIVHAIPGIGSKSRPAERSGPQSQPSQASETYETSIVFHFNDAHP